MARRYRLYGTLGCHLCESAESLLMPYVAAGAIEVELIDIVDDDALLENYGMHIPVLAASGGGEPLYWPFDASRLAVYLAVH